MRRYWWWLSLSLLIINAWCDDPGADNILLEQDSCDSNIDEIRSVITRAFGQSDGADMIKNVQESPYEYVKAKPPIVAELAYAVIMKAFSQMTRQQLYERILNLVAEIKELSTNTLNGSTPINHRFPSLIACNISLSCYGNRGWVTGYFHIQNVDKNYEGVHYKYIHENRYMRKGYSACGGTMSFSLNGTWVSNRLWSPWKDLEPYKYNQYMVTDCDNTTIHQLVKEERAYSFVNIKTDGKAKDDSGVNV